MRATSEGDSSGGRRHSHVGNSTGDLPVRVVRLSVGTLTQIFDGVEHVPVRCTTAYLMTYRRAKCTANCAFCPQARESNSSADLLSRISWPETDLESALDALPEAEGFERVCIQCLNYPRVVEDVVYLVQRIRSVTDLPISIAIGPISEQQMERLRTAGVNNIGIALDAATPEIFDKVKGRERRSSYTWEKHISALRTALRVFGKGHVTTHLIIGLGESESEALCFLKQMGRMGVTVGLFAMTGVKGTALEDMPPPPLPVYRRVQVARYILANNILLPEQLYINERGTIAVDIAPEKLREILATGEAFQTSGCKGCNRPLYNERPSGPLYNYHRPLTQEEIEQAIRETELV